MLIWGTVCNSVLDCMIRLHISPNSDVFSVATSYSLDLSNEHTDRPPSEKSNNQIVMQECSSAAAAAQNASHTDIEPAFSKAEAETY